MKTGYTQSELRAAYEICRLVKDHCANVIASGEGEKTSDKKWHRMATKFIKAYESINAYKLDMSNQLKKIKP